MSILLLLGLFLLLLGYPVSLGGHPSFHSFRLFSRLYSYSLDSLNLIYLYLYGREGDSAENRMRASRIFGERDRGRKKKKPDRVRVGLDS